MKIPSLKIIHLEDLESDAELVERELIKGDISFNKIVVDNKSSFIRALREFSPDIILSDHSLPSFNSLEALNILQQERADIPFILVTATVSEEFAVDVIKRGADDYILKDRLQRLPAAVLNAIEKHRLEVERKNTEALRVQITADLVRRNNDLEQFTYIISHNLRAPVANIIGFCNLLQEASFDQESRSKVLEQLAVSAGKLDNIIRDLNLILQDKKDITARKTIVRFQDIFDEVLPAMDLQIKKAGVTLKPVFFEAPEILTVRSYLKSIFSNVMNAFVLRLSPGSVPIIEIRTYRQQETVGIRFIGDATAAANGGGVDVTHRTTVDERETGLGMQMVKTLTEILGGNFREDGKADEPYTVTIEFFQ